MRGRLQAGTEIQRDAGGWGVGGGGELCLGLHCHHHNNKDERRLETLNDSVILFVLLVLFKLVHKPTFN